MGFFSDLKDDLSQAVNEMIPEEELMESAVEEAETVEEVEEVTSVNNIEADLSAMLDKVVGLEEEPAAAPSVPIVNFKAEEKLTTPVIDNRRIANDEISTITAGMVIQGDISSEGSIDMVGTVIGNISILGKLNITGTVQGNSQASEIYADNAKITGEVRAEGTVKVGQSTVIIGNLSGTSAVIAGAIKGDIDVKGPVILDTSAIVMGNIKSKSVQINNGAVIEGMCSQCYADVSPTSFFDDISKKGRK